MKQALKFFNALSEPTRLRITLLLMKHELCVCELESILGMEQSRISHALRVLWDAEVIVERREGRWVFYKASPELPRSLRDYLEEEAKKNPEVSTDSMRAADLLESNKPPGRRCPLREKP